MTCRHCNDELELNFTTENFEKYHHCRTCEKWYEMSKERVKINGAVPIKFVELDRRLQFATTESAMFV